MRSEGGGNIPAALWKARLSTISAPRSHLPCRRTLSPALPCGRCGSLGTYHGRIEDLHGLKRFGFRVFVPHSKLVIGIPSSKNPDLQRENSWLGCKGIRRNIQQCLVIEDARRKVAPNVCHVFNGLPTKSRIIPCPYVIDVMFLRTCCCLPENSRPRREIHCHHDRPSSLDTHPHSMFR